MTQDKREFERHAIEIDIAVEVGGERVQVKTVNLSGGGVGISVGRDLAPGEEVRVQLPLTSSPDGPAPMWLKGSVRWTGMADAGRWIAGVRFDDLEPEQRANVTRILSKLDPG